MAGARPLGFARYRTPNRLCNNFFEMRNLDMINYRGKLVLAPMVRSGELPTRLLSLIYGADLVWTPEIVDKKLLTCTKRINHTLNTTEYCDPNGRIIFNTYKPLESGKLVFQMGSADPDLAVQAALKVIDDVDGIDLNCGCPKNFSVHAGMGAALLSNSKLLCEILDNLVKKVGMPHNKPISCKIRLLKDLDSTVQLVEQICQTGINNLTVHCRTRDMRNREEPVHDYLSEIIKVTNKYDISFIINGNLMNKLDYLKLKNTYGSDISGMVAESAEANPTAFSLNPLPWNKVVYEFLKICFKFDNNPANTKYILLNQMSGKSPYYQQFARLKSNIDMLNLAKQIQLDAENNAQKSLGTIKFKLLQKDKLLTQEQYDTLKQEIAPEETESPIPLIDLETDFKVDKIAQNFAAKRKLSFEEADKTHKAVKT